MDFSEEERKTIEVLKESVIKAGEIIKARWGKFRSYSKKADYDYVTEVDKEAEEVIIKTIKHAFPEDIIIAEESFSGGYPKDKPAWLIDPLDGTTNFIHGFPMVSVSVARYKDGKIAGGSVYDPVREELFWSIRGHGFYLNDSKVTRNNDFPISQALVATGFPFRRKNFFGEYIKSFELIFYQVSDIRRAGSAALDLTYVALGRLDGFWEAGLKPWDIGAGMLFILETGGIVSDFLGGGENEVLWNGDIVASSSPMLHKVMLEIIQKSIAERG